VLCAVTLFKGKDPLSHMSVFSENQLKNFVKFRNPKKSAKQKSRALISYRVQVTIAIGHNVSGAEVSVVVWW
jgi:hypothetical protein